MRRVYQFTLLFALSSFSATAQWTTSGTGDAYNNNSSGKVGIGTSTPGYTLDVYAPANTWKARFGGPDGYITIGPANSGTAHIYTDRSSFIFNQPIWSYVGVFSSYNTSDLSLQTNGTTRMTISNSNGYVGIGTSSPGARFTVALPGYTGTPANSALAFINQSTNPVGADLKPALEVSNNGGGGYGLISLAVNNYFSGNVSIGASAPQAKVHVADGGQTIKLLTGSNSSGYDLSLGVNDDGVNFSNNSTSRGYNFSNAAGRLVTIKSNGYVGIGALSSVNANLQVGESTVNGLVNLGGYSHVGSLRSSGDFFAGMNAYAQYNVGDENKIKVLNGNGYGFSAIQMSYNGDISFYTKSGTVYANDQINVAATTALKISGNVGIGNTNPDAKLAVSGQVHAQEVKVSVSVPGPDYVFEKEYKLTSLEEIKNYIDQNKHLPEVPSAKEMEKNGVQLGEMNMLLLKKIEELTLYILNQQEEIKAQRKEIEMLKNK